MGLIIIGPESADRSKLSQPCLITPMTFMHFLSGGMFFIAYWLLTLFKKNKDFKKNKNSILYSFIIIFTLSFLYEILDYYGTLNDGSWLSNMSLDVHNFWYNFSGAGDLKDPGAIDNSIENSIGDQIFCTLGIILSIYLALKYFNKYNKFYLAASSLIIYIVAQLILNFINNL